MRRLEGKRVFSFVLATMMALVLSCGALVGCGSGSGSGNDAAEETKEPEPYEAFVGTWEYEESGSMVIAEDATFVLTWPSGESYEGTWEMADEDTMTLTVTDESFPNEEKTDNVTINEDGTQLTDDYETVLTKKE